MSPKPRRRWYQFGLSTLLIGMTLFSLPLGYVAWEREQCQRGEAAIAMLDNGFGIYGRQPKFVGDSEVLRPSSTRPTWLKTVLGDDRFRFVISAEMFDVDVNDDDLRQVSALPNLKHIGILSPKVTDEGISHLQKLQMVESFHFMGNEKVSGKSWQLLTEWRHLNHLSMLRSNFDDSGLLALSSNVTLEELNLHSTQVTDDGLRHLSDMPSLRRLELDYTRVNGSGLAYLARLPRLESLVLGGPQFSDGGLANLAELTCLKTLSLHGTIVTDTGVSHLARLKKLEKLYLQETSVTDIAKLKGSLPDMSIVDLSTR